MDVLVPELLERLRGECGAGRGRAVDDDLRALVGGDALDTRLEIPARNVDGAGEVAFLPLVGFADIDPDGAFERLGGAGVDLVDLGLGVLEQLAVGRHNYPNGSGSQGISR